jgi:methyl-accepting chemotaxis protein
MKEKLKLKLKAKTLWIPVSLIVFSFMLIAVVFVNLISKNLKSTLNNELTQLIENADRQVDIGLLLVSSTQLPADAFLGLEGDDDELAKDLIKQTSSLGLDDVFITDLQGSLIFSESDKEGVEYNSEFGPDFKNLLTNAPKKANSIKVIYFKNHIVGYAPIFDVETPKGFIVFAIDIPEELKDITSTFMRSHSNSAESDEIILISEHLMNINNSAQASAKRILNKMYITMAVILIPTLALIIFVLGTNARNIILRIRRLLEAFIRQADGDLTQKVYVGSEDEVADLTQSFNATNRKLHDMVGQIVRNAVSVASSSNQLSETAKNISSDAMDQKDKTDIVARSMEQLSVTFLEVSRNTSSASTSANEANDLATKGGDVVVKTVSGMNRIADSVRESSATVEALGERSEQIGEIIKVINDIAGQTNLLALNAAIEAARAGEQGRGFAVVADEVRKLAERTTSATNEIGDMIKGIQDDTGKAVESMHAGTKEVEEGVKLSREAGEALEKIVTSVQNVTEMIQQISAAVEEQSSASGDIINSISDVSSITSKNSDNAQASSEAILDLNSMASELHELVSEFKLDQTREDRAGNVGLNQLNSPEPGEEGDTTNV